MIKRDPHEVEELREIIWEETPPLPVIIWTLVQLNLGATTLISNHSVLDLYLDNTS